LRFVQGHKVIPKDGGLWHGATEQEEGRRDAGAPRGKRERFDVVAEVSRLPASQCRDAPWGTPRGVSTMAANGSKFSSPPPQFSSSGSSPSRIIKFCKILAVNPQIRRLPMW